MIESLADIVSRCGIVNVDFADFQSTVRDVGELFFKIASVSRNEVERVGEALFFDQPADKKHWGWTRVVYSH